MTAPEPFSPKIAAQSLNRNPKLAARVERALVRAEADCADVRNAALRPGER
jgi:hypothetical protein